MVDISSNDHDCVCSPVLMQAIGRTPLTSISPKKTWEGAIVGLGGCVATSVVLSKIFSWPSSWVRYSIYLTSNDVLKICDPKVDFSLSHADRNHNFKSAHIHSLKRQVVVSEFFF